MKTEVQKTGETWSRSFGKEERVWKDAKSLRNWVRGVVKNVGIKEKQAGCGGEEYR